MKKLIILSLFVLFSVQNTYGQTKNKNSGVVLTGETEMNLKEIAKNIGFRGSLVMSLQELMGASVTAAVIKQNGDGNYAKIVQNGANQFGYILQVGSFNNATLRMHGSDNNAILKQRGDYLATGVKLAGYNNDFKLLQKGTNLSNNIKLLDIMGTDILMLQTQNRFLYSQNASGNGIPLTIKTSQSVPTIIVRNN